MERSSTLHGEIVPKIIPGIWLLSPCSPCVQGHCFERMEDPLTRFSKDDWGSACFDTAFGVFTVLFEKSVDWRKSKTRRDFL